MSKMQALSCAHTHQDDTRRVPAGDGSLAHGTHRAQCHRVEESRPLGALEMLAKCKAIWRSETV